MALPKPHEGLVVRYGYLWEWQRRQGQEEGKDRPCMILRLYQTPDMPAPRAIVLPITHAPPDPGLGQEGIEIPATTARRLGLDDERSWLMVSECNLFRWPGPDVRPVDATRNAYGPIPPSLYGRARDRFVERAGQRRVTAVTRSE